jgi:hypothetical protein
MVFICRFTIWQSRGNLVRLELDPAGDAFGDCRLPHARFAKEEHRVRALAMAEDLEHAVHLGVAAEHRGHAILPGELIEVRREMFEERGQLETLLQPLLAKLMVAHPGGEPRHQRFRLDAVAPDDRDRNPLGLLENRREQIRGLDRVAARAAGVQQGELEQELRRRRDADFAAGHARQQAQVILERLQDFVGVQFQVAHDLPEHVPFDLRKGKADVLVRQQRVFAPPCLLERAIHDALGRFSQFVLRDVEVFHERLPSLLQ